MLLFTLDFATYCPLWLEYSSLTLRSLRLWEAQAYAPNLSCVLLTTPLILYYNFWFIYHKLLKGKNSVCLSTLPYILTVLVHRRHSMAIDE